MFHENKDGYIIFVIIFKSEIYTECFFFCDLKKKLLIVYTILFLGTKFVNIFSTYSRNVCDTLN